MHSLTRLRGATLIELIATIVIVSVAIVGLMAAISGTVSESADPMIEQQAGSIAEAYLEEATLAAFCDPDFLMPGQTCRTACTASACSTGACGGTGALKEASRNLYDDVCDYDGLIDNGAEDRNGAAITGLGAYTVTVDVVDSGISLGSPAISAAAGEVVRVNVTVQHAGLDAPLVLTGFRANTQ